MRSYVALLPLGLGLALLGLNLLGLSSGFQRMMAPEESPFGPPGYRRRLVPYTEALTQYRTLAPKEASAEVTARELLSLVFASFAHSSSEPYLYRPWDDWWIWLRGFKDPRFRIPQDAWFLWQRGWGFCDQAAMVYTALAIELGFKARLVWLSGHVISEVMLPTSGQPGGSAGDWRWVAVDPDLGIFWGAPLPELGSSSSIASMIEAHGYPITLAQKLSEAYASLADNKVSDYPYLPRFFRAQRRSLLVKWAVPFALVLGGILLMVARSSNNSQPRRQVV